MLIGQLSLWKDPATQISQELDYRTVEMATHAQRGKPNWELAASHTVSDKKSKGMCSTLTYQNKSKLLLSSSWRIHRGLWHGHQLHSLLEVSLNLGSFSLWQYGVLFGLRKQAKPIARCHYQREQAKDCSAKCHFNNRCMFRIAILQSQCWARGGWQLMTFNSVHWKSTLQTLSQKTSPKTTRNSTQDQAITPARH